MAQPEPKRPRRPAEVEVEVEAETDADAEARIERVRPLRAEPDPEPVRPAEPAREERVRSERIHTERVREVEPTRVREVEPVVVRAVPSPWTRLTYAVDYVFYLLYGLLTIRLVLGLLGASEGAPFVRFIQGITGPFYAPFEAIVSRPTVDGGYLDFPVVIAILAYVLLHTAVRGLIRVAQGRSPGR